VIEINILYSAMNSIQNSQVDPRSPPKAPPLGTYLILLLFYPAFSGFILFIRSPSSSKQTSSDFRCSTRFNYLLRCHIFSILNLQQPEDSMSVIIKGREISSQIKVPPSSNTDFHLQVFASRGLGGGATSVIGVHGMVVCIFLQCCASVSCFDFGVVHACV